MIDKVLGFVVDRLNGALQYEYPSSEPRAVISDLGGPESAAVENKIVLSIANIERETGNQRGNNLRVSGTGYSRIPLPLNVNLYILVSANFGDNYAEGLKLLSDALGFFHSSAVMTPATSPAFP